MRPSRLGRIGVIMRQDGRAFVRDRFILLISTIALVFYVAIFYVLPDQVEQTVHIGIHHPAELFVPSQMGKPGLELVRFETSEALAEAIEDEDTELIAGIDLPDDLLRRGASAQPVRVTLYLDARAPPEMRPIVAAIVRELVYFVIGEPVPVTLPDWTQLVLGEDMIGEQPSSRDRFRSFLALVVLGLEMIALGSLVAKEVQSRTVTAILVTPTTVFDFLLAKAVFGTSLAFLQAATVLLAVGALTLAPVPMLVLLLLGALMFTGAAMIAGARGRNFTEVLFWVMLFFLPAIVPAVAALFPGSTSTWVKLFPTYPLAAALDAATSHGAGLVEIAPWVGMLVAWDIVIFGLGWWILARKVASL